MTLIPAATEPRPLGALASAVGTEHVPTPFVVLDSERVERNLEHMEAYFRDRPARVRPHVKSHKCTAIAVLQAATHGAGVTCSTTDEVTVMVRAGIGDVLLANVVTDRQRLRALAAAGREARVTAAVDSLAAARLMSEAAVEAEATLEVVVEYDAGMGRNGVTSVDEGVRLAGELTALPGLRLRGVMAYEGHVIETEDRAERGARAVEALAPAVELLHELRNRGYDVPMFTGGSSATYDASGALPEMTDVQAGTYVLMDETYRQLAPEFEPALVVVASVLTARPDGTLVVDAGVKRLGTDWGDPAIADVEAEFVYTAEEHAVFRLLGGPLPPVGSRVALIPGHVCTTLTRYRSVLACRDGAVERTLAVDGRDPLD